MTDVIYRLHRFSSGIEATLGVVHKVSGPLLSFRCFTLEDEKRAIKVMGETRIPAGRYEIRLRTEGGMSAKYAAKYPWHKGMLWLQNVPGFEWVYIHVGNLDKHTAGCVLIGYSADSTGNMSIGKSELAYETLYKEIAKHLQNGDKVFIEVVDFA